MSNLKCHSVIAKTSSAFQTKLFIHHQIRKLRILRLGTCCNWQYHPSEQQVDVLGDIDGLGKFPIILAVGWGIYTVRITLLKLFINSLSQTYDFYKPKQNDNKNLVYHTMKSRKRNKHGTAILKKILLRYVCVIAIKPTIAHVQ